MLSISHRYSPFFFQCDPRNMRLMVVGDTHTVVTLEISDAAYAEIRAKLEAADYQHAFMPNGEIDMTGIAVYANPTQE